MNATVNRHTTITKCIATQRTPLKGCHSCEKPATTTISCQSRVPMKALILCPDYTSSIDCGPIAQDNLLRMAISSEPKEAITVEIICNVSCGITSSILINGQLEYEANFQHAGNSAAQMYERIADLPSLLGSMSKCLNEAVFEKLFYFGVIIGVVVVMYFGYKLAIRYNAYALVHRTNPRRRRQKKTI